MKKAVTKRGQAAVAAAEALVRCMALEQGVALKRSRERAESMGAAAVLPLSQAMLAAPRWQLRWEAAKALGRIAAPGSAAALVRALDDENSDVGWVAAESLAALGDAALPPLLQALAKRPGAPGLRIGARHVLRGRQRLDHGDRTVGVLAAIEGGATDDAAAVAAHGLLMRAKKARPPAAKKKAAA
jgi:HEAT repeat protein